MSRWYLSCLLLLLVLGVCWAVMHPSAADDAHLKKIIELASPSSREKAGGIVSYCQQLRGNVTKQLINREQAPRLLRIYSKDSELFFFKQDKQIEIIEELDDIRCMLQEKLTYSPEGYPIQIVHTIESARACYNYQTQVLTANNATVRKYTLPGHTLEQYPTVGAVMTAHAKQVLLNITEHHYNLDAKGLRLILEE